MRGTTEAGDAARFVTRSAVVIVAPGAATTVEESRGASATAPVCARALTAPESESATSAERSRARIVLP